MLDFPPHPDIRNLRAELLSDNWYRLERYSFERRSAAGQWEPQQREAYDRGNGATILLYDLVRRVLILTEQFRLPTYINGNPDGQLIEACAGLLDADDPETCIRREAMEETGYEVHELSELFQLYMSPGSVAELVHFYIAPCSAVQKTGAGGGVAAEQERIRLVELPFAEALGWIDGGRLRDGKTVLLVYHFLFRVLPGLGTQGP